MTSTQTNSKMEVNISRDYLVQEK